MITHVTYNCLFLQSAPMSPYNTAPPIYFGGIGAPPLPYGMSTRYGSPVPHSGMHYDYGLPSSAHGPYGPLPTFPPGGYGGNLLL